jgi:hypothetical protein
MHPRARLLFFLLSCGALAAASCADSDRACYPSDWRACSCDDSAAGYQQCSVDGSAYGACDCSGMIPGLTTSAASGGGGDGGAGGSGKLPFMAECTTDQECETGLCYPFNAKGPHCSKSCSADGDCPPPSPGCSNMGVCKAP